MATSRSGGSKRGFAAMDPAKQREIASKGGKASHGGGRKSSSEPIIRFAFEKTPGPSARRFLRLGCAATT